MSTALVPTRTRYTLATALGFGPDRPLRVAMQAQRDALDLVRHAEWLRTPVRCDGGHSMTMADACCADTDSAVCPTHCPAER